MAKKKKKSKAEHHLHDHAHSHDEDHSHHAHDHEHPHDHAHDHDHTHALHAHDHSEKQAPCEVLKPHEGRGKTLFFDAPSGLAGDMIVAALVDLGVPEDVILHAIDKAKLDGFHVHFGQKAESGIVATTFDVHVDAAQPERTYGSIKALLDRIQLSDDVRARAHATFRKLAESEARVHRMRLEDVHFHEVGAVDSIVDVIASAAALAYLGADNIVVSPLPMGRGFVKARHGVLPLPAPATVLCLQGFDTYDGGRDFEFVTPTGAAVIAANARGSSRWPNLAPVAIGFGAGTAKIADRPNLLRVVLGAEVSTNTLENKGETHVVIEANVDDMTGEMVAYCMQALLASGALDAWATPVIMKKGRPALTLSAIAEAAHAQDVAATMIRESTTIGVRMHPVSRIERPRAIRYVETRFGEIPVKLSAGEFGAPLAKPEFDACAEIAKREHVPIREVIEAAQHAAQHDREPAPHDHEEEEKRKKRKSEATPQKKPKSKGRTSRSQKLDP